MTTATRVSLRALDGEPLSDARVESTVTAQAHALAERTGLHILELLTEPTTITVVLDADRLTALAFAAELRRTTARWYAAHTRRERNEDEPEPALWGEPRHKSDDDEPWKPGSLDDWLPDTPEEDPGGDP
ncbi:MAG: hypothetical protein AAGG07_08630 [Planctomycetota bacterium]